MASNTPKQTEPKKGRKIIGLDRNMASQKPQPAFPTAHTSTKPSKMSRPLKRKAESNATPSATSNLETTETQADNQDSASTPFGQPKKKGPASSKKAQAPSKKTQAPSKKSSDPLEAEEDPANTNESETRPLKRPSLSHKAAGARQHIVKAKPNGYYNSSLSDYTKSAVQNEQSTIQQVYNELNTKNEFNNSNYIKTLDAESEELKWFLDGLIGREARMRQPGRVGAGVSLYKPLTHFREPAKALMTLGPYDRHRIVEAEMAKMIDGFDKKLQLLDPQNAETQEEQDKAEAEVDAYTWLKGLNEAGCKAVAQGRKGRYVPGESFS